MRRPKTTTSAEATTRPDAMTDGTAVAEASPKLSAQPPSDAAPLLRTSAPPEHLSAVIRMDHWLPLLVALATWLLMAASLYVIVRLLTLVHHTVLLFSLGGIVAYALDPVVEWVRGTYRPPAAPRRPRWLGVLTVFAILIVAWGAGTFFLGKEAAAQAQYLAANRDQLQMSAEARVQQWDDDLAARGIPIRLTELMNHPPENVRAWGESVARGSLGFFSEVSRSAVEGVIVLLIAVYFLIYSEEMSGGVLRALPDRLRPYAEQWRGDVNRILGGFVRGQAILAMVLGAAAAAACLVIGLKPWLLIGFFVVLASLLPVIGPYIGAIPALIAAVLTAPNGFLNPLTRAIFVVVLFVLINEAGSKILYPRLVGKALGLHEVVVLIVLLGGFEIGGIAGVFFAAPLTALAVVTVAQLWRLWHGEPPISLSAAARAAGREQRAEGTP